MIRRNVYPVPGRRFNVVVAGNTNGTHAPFVSHLKKRNYHEVHSPQESDFLLVFCPVVSRVGTDIGEALHTVDRDKPKVLVVMHHTFDPNTAIAESRRQVEDPNVLLTVDCLFHESRLLDCDRNNIAWDQICRSLAILSPQPSYWKRFKNAVNSIAVLLVGAVAFFISCITHPLDVIKSIISFCLSMFMGMVNFIVKPLKKFSFLRRTEKNN